MECERSQEQQSHMQQRSLARLLIRSHRPPRLQKAQTLLAYAITIAAFEVEQTIFSLRSSTQSLVLHLPKRWNPEWMGGDSAKPTLILCTKCGYRILRFKSDNV